MGSIPTLGTMLPIFITPTTVVMCKEIPGAVAQLVERRLPGGNQMVLFLLFYTLATVFQLFHRGDMIYEMRRRKPKPTLLPS